MKTRKTRHKKLMNKYYTFNFIVFLMFVCGIVWFIVRITKHIDTWFVLCGRLFIQIN